MKGRVWMLDLKYGGWAWEEDQRKKDGKQEMRASDNLTAPVGAMARCQPAGWGGRS